MFYLLCFYNTASGLHFHYETDSIAQAFNHIRQTVDKDSILYDTLRFDSKAAAMDYIQTVDLNKEPCYRRPLRVDL